MDYPVHTFKVGLSTRRSISNGILSFYAKSHSKSLLFCERSVQMEVKEGEKFALDPAA